MRSDAELVDAVQSQAYAHGISVTGAVGSREDATRAAEESLRACAELLRRLTALRAAVRAADAMAEWIEPSRDLRAEKALDDYRQARAKCEPGKETT